MDQLFVINPDYLLHIPKLERSTNIIEGMPDWYPKSPPISPVAIDDYNTIHKKIDNNNKNTFQSLDLDDIQSITGTDIEITRSIKIEEKKQRPASISPLEIYDFDLNQEFIIN